MSVCVACDNQFEKGDIITSCSCCGDLYHASVECTGVSASEQKVFTLRMVKPMLVYRCRQCIKLGGNSVFVNAVSEFKSSIQDLLTASEKIKVLVDEVEGIKKDIKNLKQSSNSADSLREEFNGLHEEAIAEVIAVNKKVDKVKFTVDNLPSVDVMERELQDRKVRCCNVIFYNVIEPNLVTNDASADLASIKAMLAEIGNVKADSISVMRMGKPKKDITRPIAVTLSSRSDVFRVLRARNKLPEGVKTAIDRTVMQREALKRLYEYVDEHNSKSEDRLKVKYINNVPTAVSISEERESLSKNGAAGLVKGTS